jgi:hypothetical protein
MHKTELESRRREIGLIERNVEEERREFREMFRWLRKELFPG